MKQLNTYICFVFICLAMAFDAYGQSIDYDAWRNASNLQPYDVTQLIVNPSGTGNNGWSRNSADAAAGYNKHNTEFGSTTYDGIGIESWYWTPVKTADLIWQDVKGLLPGTYRVKAYAVAQIYNDGNRKGQLGKGTYLFAGEEKTAITSNKWQELTITVVVDDSQTLRIGICGDATNENDWVSIAQVKLECIGFSGFSNPKQLVLDERYDVSAAREAGLFDVILLRTLWNDRYTAFCIPFTMNATDVDRHFSEVLEVTGATFSGGAYQLKTSESAIVKAGTPYLVKSKKNGRQAIEVQAVGITPLNEACSEVKTFSTMHCMASYRAHDYIPSAYLLDNGGKKLIKSNAPVKIKGYSFYFQK